MLFPPDLPLSDLEDDPLITVQYNYVFGTSWEECGVSRADGLLTALGFSTREEVAAFCVSVNVFEEFSTNEFIKKYINLEDRQRLAKFGKARNQVKLFPDTLTFKPVNAIFEENLKPGYEDFFQVLFTWLTHGDNASRRSSFVAWWQSPAGEPSMSVRNPYAIKTDTVMVRKSFKNAIETFLQQRKNSQSAAQSTGSSNPFVDVVHCVKTKLLNVFLKQSDWAYTSGNDVNVGVQTPLKGVSAGVGIGTFGVYKQTDSKTVYPLKFAVASVGTGFGPSSPVNLSINPSVFPTAGKIYYGLSSSTLSNASFYGAFVTLGVGAADVANQTSSLMFIAPTFALPFVPCPGMDGARWTEIFLSVLPLSSAIIALDGNGVELSIGVSAQLSCGFVVPNN